MDAPTRSLRPSPGQRALAEALARGEAVMGKAVQSVPSSVYIDPDRFEAWTYRVIVRASTAEAKRSKRAATSLRLLPDDADRATGPDEFGAVAERDRLDRAFKRLTADQRAVLVMQHYLGLTPVDMAEELGIPVGTVGSRLHYATRALRAALEADERTTSSEERSA